MLQIAQVLESKSPTLDGADLTALLDALRKYPNQRNFSELRNRLVQWATDHQLTMRSQELERMLTTWVSKASTEQAVTQVTLDTDKCGQLLSKLAKPVPEPLQIALRSTIPLLMRQVATEAPGSC